MKLEFCIILFGKGQKAREKIKEQHSFASNPFVPDKFKKQNDQILHIVALLGLPIDLALPPPLWTLSILSGHFNSGAFKLGFRAWLYANGCVMCDKVQDMGAVVQLGSTAGVQVQRQ